MNALAAPPPAAVAAGFTSLEWIDWVIALDDEPVQRNLLITQGYHDLSEALAGALGRENANWCTFATWASQTAGRFIREEEVPAVVRLLLGRIAPIQVVLAHVDAALARVHEEASVDRDGVLDTIRGVVHDVSQLIAAGNLEVFGELAPLFSRVSAAFAAEEGADALDDVIAGLRPGSSERGGQALLAGALHTYAEARGEHDVRRKAALMLRANGEVGLHEQIRLQPFIAGAIDAPIRDALAAALEEVGEGLPRPLAHEVHAVVSRAVHPIADAAESAWEEIVTCELMTLQLPDAELMLGRDLPAPRGEPLYPPVLDPVDDRQTLALLASFGAVDPLEHGGATQDWARLSERMRYILELFRSRQLDARLHDEPFTAAQRATARGIVA
jgi:hypothetical protein